MSDYEYRTGKLIPCELHGSIEETCKKILESEGHEKSEWHDTYAEALSDACYKEYFVTDTAIYKIDSKNRDPYEDIFEAIKNKDGTINFTVKYYNGGCSLDDALEAALENME